MQSNGFSIIVFMAITFLFYLAVTYKKVPYNTTIIIDRDSHFYKKKNRGYYKLGPKDQITTIVSTDQIIQNYNNVFKAHDDVYFFVSFSVKYYSFDVAQTLDALSDSRRSIYDICNCAAETVIGSLESSKSPTLAELSIQLNNQLESTLESFYIDVTDTAVSSYRYVSEEQGKNQVFARHESSGSNPIGG